MPRRRVYPSGLHLATSGEDAVAHKVSFRLAFGGRVSAGGVAVRLEATRVRFYAHLEGEGMTASVFKV